MAAQIAANAQIVHYDGDSRQLADGDATVVDIGAAFDEHCSDWSSTEPFRVGYVLTIEPGVCIQSEGLGVRIEDTYLVTATGLACLSCGSPKQIREIERGL